MDTKTLVVGQKVHFWSGCYGGEGEVVETTPSGVTVLAEDGKRLKFDSDGVGQFAGTYGNGPYRMMIDTKTLVVGQQVRITCGHYGRLAVVDKVTPDGVVDVDAGGRTIIRFNNKGEGYYITEELIEPLGPWYLSF
jgi:hypothetical protein